MYTSSTDTALPENGRKVGQRVICDGHEGTITRVCEWAPTIVEVRLERGTVCVPFGYPDCYVPNKAGR